MRGLGFVLVVAILLGVIVIILNNAKPPDRTIAPSPASAVTFGLEQQIHVGYWEYAVHSARFYPLVYEATGVRQPDSGTFLMLDVTVRNLDRTESARPPFKLVDEASLAKPKRGKRIS